VTAVRTKRSFNPRGSTSFTKLPSQTRPPCGVTESPNTVTINEFAFGLISAGRAAKCVAKPASPCGAFVANSAVTVT